MKYISILRGINVSGQKKIKMSDLRLLYESLGFQNVVTYIQSGNVIFDTTVKNMADLKISIENAIEEKYEYHIPVIIRTNSEIGDIIKNCPFGLVDLVKDGTRILVTILTSEPSETRISAILKYAAATEKIVISGKEVYLYCPNGYGKSKLSNTLLEKKLGIDATTRNWKTIHKLYELSI